MRILESDLQRSSVVSRVIYQAVTGTVIGMGEWTEKAYNLRSPREVTQ